MKSRFSIKVAHPGFTLIELLLVIGIIGLLASIVIMAINPTRQLQAARNTQRRSDANTILNAVYQYAIDHNGNLPDGIPTSSATAKPICSEYFTGGQASCTAAPFNGVWLGALSGSYVVSIPRDPQVAATNTGTRYNIYRGDNSRITVFSTGIASDGGGTITVTR